MNKYFNINLEFDKSKVDEIINDAIKNNQRGYVCSVERNVVTIANKDAVYNDVVNNALVNICDGNYVAKLINIVYKKRYCAYVGAEMFISYIKKKEYSQYFLGNTQEVLEGLRIKMSIIDPKIQNMPFETLPFLKVNEFDYPCIAEKINKYKPDIIWVSLGAPKQEMFMSKLLPYLNRGVMFGFGAIFNFYSGVKGQERAPEILLRYHLEWLYRVFQDPKKNMKRNIDFIKIIPLLLANK